MEMLREPEKEEEPVPLTNRLPPIEAYPMVSKLADREALVREVKPVTFRVENKDTAPEMEAVPPTSNEASVAFPALMPNLESVVISRLVETDTPALKVLRADQVLAWEREGTPLEDQSNLTYDSDEILEMLKELFSNEIEVICRKVEAFDSLTPREPRLVSRSVPHEN